MGAWRRIKSFANNLSPAAIARHVLGWLVGNVLFALLSLALGAVLQLPLVTIIGSAVASVLGAVTVGVWLVERGRGGGITSAPAETRSSEPSADTASLSSIVSEANAPVFQWDKHFRAYRGPKPEPGNDRGSAHVGDYLTYDAAIEGCRAHGVGAGIYWIEPIEFNGDAHRPEYRNAGPIEKAHLGWAAWTALVVETLLPRTPGESTAWLTVRSDPPEYLDRFRCIVVGSLPRAVANEMQRNSWAGFAYPQDFRFEDGQARTWPPSPGSYLVTWWEPRQRPSGEVETQFIDACQFNVGMGGQIE